MGVLSPLSPFCMEVLRVLNVSPTKRFPNSRGFIRDFEMVCKELDITPTVAVFFSFYTTRLTKGSWVSLGNLSGKVMFTSHSNQYKNWRGMFSRVRGRETSLGVLGDDGSPSFL